jgi:hypothetical protein
MLIRTTVVLAFLILSLQLVSPGLINGLNNPPVTADLKVPSEVKQILRRSCYDCHSNETRLAWFDRFVPAIQFVARDIRRGRIALNFSELAGQSMARQNAVLFESLNHIQMGVMPLSRYTLFHPEAKVTPSQLAIIRNYLLHVQPAELSARDVDAADTQYSQWITANSDPFKVQAAPNGIAFLPGYKNWKVVSSTDREDSGTLKMILGNDVAIEAIADHNINPWPNGTAFAKVSWRQQPGEDGEIRTGQFEQVAFMIKNNEEYASTAGWGWAQWMGSELKPFGTDAGFARDCVACHAPLRRNDYVFTAPIATLRGPA